MTEPERQPGLAWIRPPVQGRSRQTLERLLDATERLLLERTFDEVGITDIVREAKSSVGSFYGRFESKDALLLALHERYDVESRATSDAAFDPAALQGVPLPLVVRSFCDFIVQYTRENLGLRRALIIAIASKELHRESAQELAASVVRNLRALLEQRRDEHQHSDPLLAAHMVHRIAFSLLDQELVFHGSSPTGRKLKPAELSREMTRACLGYLGAALPEDA